MPWINQNNATTPEKVVSGLCYLTFGLAGILYIIFSGKRSQSSFFRFHFLQSIFIGIIRILFGWTSNIFVMLITSIFSLLGPMIGAQIGSLVGLCFNLIVTATTLLLVYGMIFAFLGKYAEIPFISNTVRKQL